MRILSEPVGAGSMQNRFRVEVRRCNLSHELFSSQPDGAVAGKSGFPQHSLATKTLRHMRKGFEAFPGPPQPVQQYRKLARHRDDGSFLSCTRCSFGESPLP